MASSKNYSFNGFVEYLFNNFGLILLAVIVFAGGFFIGSIWTEKELLKSGAKVAQAQPAAAADAQPAGDTGPTVDQLAKVPEITDKDHLRGNAKADVVLIEYSDYECPFCAQFHPTMVQVMEEYGDKIAWVFRQYPLPFHPLAQPAAETAECVSTQGGNEAFWKYTDSLFKANKEKGVITQTDLDNAVIAAGVDKGKVGACVTAGETKTIVSTMMEGGSGAGVNGTPGTIIKTRDGKYELIGGALPFAQVKATLDKYVK